MKSELIVDLAFTALKIGLAELQRKRRNKDVMEWSDRDVIEALRKFREEIADTDELLGWDRGR